MTDRCPFCGTPGEYVTADEGTSYFAPTPDPLLDVGPRDPESWKSGWNAAVKAYRDGEMRLPTPDPLPCGCGPYAPCPKHEDDDLKFQTDLAYAGHEAAAPTPDPLLDVERLARALDKYVMPLRGLYIPVEDIAREYAALASKEVSK